MSFKNVRLDGYFEVFKTDKRIPNRQTVQQQLDPVFVLPRRWLLTTNGTFFILTLRPLSYKVKHMMKLETSFVSYLKKLDYHGIHVHA